MQRSLELDCPMAKLYPDKYTKRMTSPLDPIASVRVSTTDAPTFFTNERTGDVLFTASDSTHRILIGNSANYNPVLELGSSNAYVHGDAIIHNVSTNVVNSTVLDLYMPDAAAPENFAVPAYTNFSMSTTVAEAWYASNAIYEINQTIQNLPTTGGGGSTVLASNVTGIFSASNTANFASAVNVLGNTSMYNTVNMSNAVFASSNLSVAKDLRVEGTTALVGPTVTSGIVSMSNAVFAGSNLSLQNDLLVKGSTTLSNDAIVYGSLTSSNNAFFTSNVFIGGALNAQAINVAFSNVLIYSSTEIYSNAMVDGSFTASNNVTAASNLLVFGTSTHSNAVRMSSNLSVGGPVVLNGSLTTLGTATLSNTVLVNGVATFSNAVFASSNLSVNGPSTLSDALMVYGPYTLSNTMMVYNTASFSNNVNVSGYVSAVQDVSVTSDSRLKTNVVLIDDALRKVNNISGYTFERIDDVNVPRARHCGLLAQELKEVLPEAVHTNDNGFLTVAYGNVVSLLVQAIKELHNKFGAIEQRVSDLESAPAP